MSCHNRAYFGLNPGHLMARDKPRNVFEEFRINKEAYTQIEALKKNPPEAVKREIRSFFEKRDANAILNEETIHHIMEYLNAKNAEVWTEEELLILDWLLRALLATKKAAVYDTSISVPTVYAVVSNAVAFVSSALKSICNLKRALDVLKILKLFKECEPAVLANKMPEIDQIFTEHLISLSRYERIDLIGEGIRIYDRALMICPQFIKFICDEVAADRPEILGLGEYQIEFQYREGLIDSLATIVNTDNDLAGRIYEDSKIVQTCLRYREQTIGVKLVKALVEIEKHFTDFSKMKMLTDSSFVEFVIVNDSRNSNWIRDYLLNALDVPSCSQILEFLIDRGLYSSRPTYRIDNAFIVAQQRKRIVRKKLGSDRKLVAQMQWSFEYQLAEDKQKRRHPARIFVLFDEHSEI